MSAYTPPRRRAVSAKPLAVGQPLKAVMALADIATLLGMTHDGAYKLEQRGDLKRFELPALGRRRRYSGKRFQAWLDTEPELRPRLGTPRSAKVTRAEQETHL